MANNFRVQTLIAKILRAFLGGYLDLQNDAGTSVMRVGTGTNKTGVEQGTGSANGIFAHAEGNDCTASGAYSHAEGLNSVASGDYSHAEGNGCTAGPGAYTHAEGLTSEALGFASHAAGRRARAKHLGSRVMVDVGSNTHEESTRNNQMTCRYAGGYIFKGGSINKISNYEYLNASNWYLTGKTFYVDIDEGSPTGVFFKPDGTLMYVIGSGNDYINVYELGIPWDVRTSVYSYQESVQTQENNPQDLYISPDGMKLFVVGSTGDDVNEYNLPSPWLLTGMTFVTSQPVGQDETAPRGIDFKPDGTKMYVVGSLGKVLEYELSTPWSVATATYTKELDVNPQETVPTGLTFNGDGNRLYVIGSTGDNITGYSLSTAYDISTALFLSESIDLPESLPSGIYFSSSRSKVYVIGTTTDTVIELGIPGNDGFVLDNPNDSTAVSPVQPPPRIRWSGTAWDTGASLTRTLSWIAENIPISGDPAASRLALSFNLDGSEYSELFSFTSGGRLGIGTDTPTEKLDVVGNANVSADITANGGEYVPTSATVLRMVSLSQAEYDALASGAGYVATTLYIII